MDDSFAFTQGDEYSGNLLANDEGPDGGALFLRFFDGQRVNAKLGTGQTTEIAGDFGMFTVRPDGSFTYTLSPGVVLRAGESITETLRVKISDGGGVTDVSQFRMTINGADEPSDPTPTLVKVTAGSNAGTSDSYGPAITADGTQIVFDSNSSNLTPGDTGILDVFLVDRATGAFTNLTQGGNGASYASTVSANGNVVAFVSQANNLVAGDSNGRQDVFVLDRAAGTFTNLTLGGNGESVAPVLSANGATIAFLSDASTLTPGDTNGARDLFVYTIATGQLVNVTGTAALGAATQGVAPQFSSDGATLLFSSVSADLTPGDDNGVSDVFVYDVATGTLRNLSQAVGGGVGGSMNADGTRIVFQGTTDAAAFKSDIFLYDAEADSFTNLTPTGDGISATPHLSADGRVLAFISTADNLVLDDAPSMYETIYDLFTYTLDTGEIRLVTRGADDSSSGLTLSADGSTLTFFSDASNLIDGETASGTNIYRYDLEDGLLSNATRTLDGVPAFSQPVLSADGSVAAFYYLSPTGAPDGGPSVDLYTYALL